MVFAAGVGVGVAVAFATTLDPVLDDDTEDSLTDSAGATEESDFTASAEASACDARYVDASCWTRTIRNPM